MPAIHSITPHLDYGYFVEDDIDFEIRHVEDPDKYGEGLLFPVCLGDWFNNRYRAFHELGHGTFSTVWLAHDTLKQKAVALKIMVPGNVAEHELHIQDEIRHRVRDTSNLVLYTDIFFVGNINNKQHRVLAFPAFAPRTNDPDFLRQIPMATRMRAAKQLLEILASLHDRGFVHGDVRGKNLMWGVVPLDSSDPNAVYKYFGRPEKLSLKPEQPAELVLPLKINPLLFQGNYISSYSMKGASGEYYDQNTKVDTTKFGTFLNRIGQEADLSKQQHAISMAMKVFRYLPEQRLTASQLLQDPSFKILTENNSPQFYA
ncbi:hypothetical protein FQN57_005086 [Myotisia sp. PD_48]|nr:hypothetical protein FQN57_005086 [Myotisia sp. PD_48]